jgi:MazG family protein
VNDDEALAKPAAAPLAEQRGGALPRLVAVMQRLLGPGGCPWDREQTIESLRPFVLEEAYEVVDAIEHGTQADLREELGDLAMQIVFLSELARDRGWFGIDDTLDAICDKLIRRHPHVFAGGSASTPEEVLVQWEATKAQERKAEGKKKGALAGVPVGMSPLSRALKIGEKAAGVGYDWPDAAGARAKIDEELGELDRAAASGDAAQIEGELGDLLFAIASWARKSKVDPEAALRGALSRFERRFGVAERAAAEAGKALGEMAPGELDTLWRKAKEEVG